MPTLLHPLPSLFALLRTRRVSLRWPIWIYLPVPLHVGQYTRYEKVHHRQPTVTTHTTINHRCRLLGGGSTGGADALIGGGGDASAAHDASTLLHNNNVPATNHGGVEAWRWSCGRGAERRCNCTLQMRLIHGDKCRSHAITSCRVVPVFLGGKLLDYVMVFVSGRVVPE